MASVSYSLAKAKGDKTAVSYTIAVDSDAIPDAPDAADYAEMAEISDNVVKTTATTFASGDKGRFSKPVNGADVADLIRDRNSLKRKDETSGNRIEKLLVPNGQK